MYIIILTMYILILTMYIRGGGGIKHGCTHAAQIAHDISCTMACRDAIPARHRARYIVRNLCGMCAKISPLTGRIVCISWG